MIYLLKLLIFGHVHQWVTVDTAEFAWEFGGKPKSGTRHTLRCSKCGDVKKVDLI